MERRAKSRIDVHLICRVAVGTLHAATVRTLTGNIGRTGILMRRTRNTPLPKVDDKPILDVQLPENSEFGPRVMRCRTEVVRVMPPEDDVPAVALRVLSVRFTAGEPTPWVSPDLVSMPVPVERVN